MEYRFLEQKISSSKDLIFFPLSFSAAILLTINELEVLEYKMEKKLSLAAISEFTSIITQSALLLILSAPLGMDSWKQTLGAQSFFNPLKQTTV